MSRLDPHGGARRRFDRGGDGPGVVEPEAWDDRTGFQASYLGWEIARCACDGGGEDGRAIAGLAAACIASIESGSTRLPLGGAGLAAAIEAAGVSKDARAVTTLAERLRRGERVAADVVGCPGERKPLVIDGEWLYVERMRVLEDRFCERVAARFDTRDEPTEAPGPEPRAAARAAKAIAGRASLTDEQAAAVRRALATRLSLISGGPGTGKTTTVVALLRALAWQGVSLDAVAIAAPTGKAAQRLTDAIGVALLANTSNDLAEVGLARLVPAPQTLHRLLGWSPERGRFARHENDPLTQRWVIVDEASMIDLALMDRLVRALRHDARLVLLGDADQLPSVEAGAVFRDLCAALGAIRLTRNLRVDRDPSAQRIVALASAINAGALEAPLSRAITRRESPEALAFQGVEHLDGSWDVVGEAFLDRWWRDRSSDPEFERRAGRTYRLTAGVFDADDERELRGLFEHHARARLLCATRVGKGASAQAINRSLVARLGSRFGAGGRRPWGIDEGLEPVPGTPVLAQRNDYMRGIYNGDQGVLARVASNMDERPTIMAVFARGDRFDAIAVEAVPDLVPAFAMTVHKAQGSEFDDVSLVLPDTESPLLTRELVYTAVTRARRSVLIIGSAERLTRAVSRVTERFSGVADRLRGRRHRPERDLAP